MLTPRSDDRGVFLRFSIFPVIAKPVRRLVVAIRIPFRAAGGRRPLHFMAYYVKIRRDIRKTRIKTRTPQVGCPYDRSRHFHNQKNGSPRWLHRLVMTWIVFFAVFSHRIAQKRHAPCTARASPRPTFINLLLSH